MIMSVLHGSPNRRQRAWAWADPSHMIIGTPEELCTMTRSGGVKRYDTSLKAPTYVRLRTGSQHFPSQLTRSCTITSESGKKLYWWWWKWKCVFITFPSTDYTATGTVIHRLGCTRIGHCRRNTHHAYGFTRHCTSFGTYGSFELIPTRQRICTTTDHESTTSKYYLFWTVNNNIYHLGFIFTFTQHITLSKPHDF